MGRRKEPFHVDKKVYDVAVSDGGTLTLPEFDPDERVRISVVFANPDGSCCTDRVRGWAFRFSAFPKWVLVLHKGKRGTSHSREWLVVDPATGCRVGWGPDVLSAMYKAWATLEGERRTRTGLGFLRLINTVADRLRRNGIHVPMNGMPELPQPSWFEWE